MSVHVFEITVTVDDAALAAHDGEKKPPPNDPSEWMYLSDITAAEDVGAVDSGQIEITGYNVGEEK